MKIKTRITKCYLVEVIDEEGNSLVSEYVFGDKEDATNEAKSLKESIKRGVPTLEDEQLVIRFNNA